MSFIINKKQFYKILKKIDELRSNTLYKRVKRLSNNDKKYLASIIVKPKQIGGGDGDNNISLILDGNKEIKRTVENLKTTMKNIVDELMLTKTENKTLKLQLKNLDKDIVKLDKSSCVDQIKQAEKYIENFLNVKKSITDVVSFTKKLLVSQSPKLELLIKSPIEYDNDLKKINQIKINKPQCENVNGIIEELEEYQNPDILNRILNDYETLSSTVRVIVRIFNESFVNPKLRQNPQKFDFKIIQDRDNTKKIKNTFTSECEISNTANLCLTPGSVINDNKDVVRTKYPCNNNSEEFIPFRYRYGPFYNVLRNQDNNALFETYKPILSGLQKGNSLLTFGYGYSGSGKTMSLLGNSTTDGLLQLSLKEIQPETLSMSLIVEELYGTIAPPTEISRGKYANEIQYKLFNYGSLSIKNIGDIQPFLNNINIQRIQKNHIKFTVNNTESSRGHLFLTMDIKFKNNTNTKFRIIDLAGAEDPFIIGELFLKINPLGLKSLTKNDIKLLLTDITNTNLKIKTTYWEEEILLNFSQKTKTDLAILPQEKVSGKIKIKIETNDDRIVNIMNRLFIFYFQNYVFGVEKFKQLFTPFKIENIVNYIWEIITEGFYINETLNHLQIFLQQQSNKTIKIIKNNTPIKDNSYKLITATQMYTGAEETKYTPFRLLFDPENQVDKNKLGFIQLLENTSPTNFSMIATLKDSLNNITCSGASSTLNFIQKPSNLNP